MARPQALPIASGQQAWDAEVNANTTRTFGQPFPPVEVNDLAALNSTYNPGDFDRCIAATVTPPALWLSNGTAWVPLAQQQAAEADLPAPTAVAGTGDDATINANFSAHQAKINALIAKLETAGILAP